MCTVSWQTAESLENGELLLYFNRDEKRKRAAGAGPELLLEKGTQYISPSDPERGGTWIAANEHGCLVCLLNDYSVSFDQEGSFKSRGVLVRELAQFHSFEEVRCYLTSDMSLPYPPFTLLFWDGKCMNQWHWNTHELTSKKNVQPPFTSSSWDTARVEKERSILFKEWVTDGGRSLEAYHTHEISGNAESSVCMSRELTQTVSLTSVFISRGKVQMYYKPRSQSGEFLSESTILLERA